MGQHQETLTILFRVVLEEIHESRIIGNPKANLTGQHDGSGTDKHADLEYFEDLYLIDGQYSIKDLVDIDRLRKIFEKFSSVTGFTVGLNAYPSQEVLIATGWRDICAKFHRIVPASAEHCKQSNVALTEKLQELHEFNISRCNNGLIDGATPIVIKGKHLANLTTGQVFFEEPDRDRFRRQGQFFGYNLEKYLEALSQVPVVSETRFREVLSLLSELAVMIAEQGLSNLELQKTTIKLEEEIAERQRVGGALLRSRETLRALLDATPESVLLLDRHGVVRAINEVAAHRLGKNIKDIVRTCIFDLLPPDVARKEERSWIEPCAPSNSCVLRIIAGTDAMNSISARYPMRPERSKKLAILAIDTTGRKLAEAELKLKEKLLDGASDSIFLHDLDGRLIYVNEAAYKSRGYEKEELLAHGYYAAGSSRVCHATLEAH